MGFNSLKMVKYRIEPSGSVTAYGQFGTMARLGEGLAQTGFLGKEQMSRTIEALKLCREAAALDHIKHTVLIATSPVREAANREEFLRRVRDEVGLGMRVLTGNEEALYGFLGASRVVASNTALYFDLGGGSLELAYAERGRVRRIISLPLGALKLSGLYAGKEGAYSKKNRAKMAKRITQMLPSKKELGIAREAMLVGMGGTVRAMARVDQGRLNYLIGKIHNYQMRYDSVRQMSREFFRASLEELEGDVLVGEGRARTIAAGGMVVRLVMECLDFGDVTVSTHGVRDGVLLEFLGQGRIVTPGGEGDRPEGSPEEGGESLPGGLGGLATCLVRNGILDHRQGSLVRTALLEGRTRDCAEADPDALFGILMSRDLPMSHQDQVLMALSLVRARRSRGASWLLERYGSMVPREDAKSVKKLGACLRLMEVMDRSGAQFRVAYSGGLRISVSDSSSFPVDLARANALALSNSIKRPVSIFAGVGGRERNPKMEEAA